MAHNQWKVRTTPGSIGAMTNSSNTLDPQAMDENGNLASLGEGKGPGPDGGKTGLTGFKGDQKGQSANYKGLGKVKPGTENYAGCHNCGSKEHIIKDKRLPAS